VCPNCKEEFVPEPEVFTKLGIEELQGRPSIMVPDAIVANAAATRVVRRSLKSCRSANRPGSHHQAASAAVIKNQAMTEGMKTLRVVGIDKAREGITTLEEVLRVTAEDH
jgi:type II secretory ATPase GspE/PulE/Tfp pilus assembly ATPase PilB-like protein